MGGATPAVSSGSLVADPVESGDVHVPKGPVQGSAFSVVVGPMGLRSSAKAQEVFRGTADRMKEIGSIPRKSEKWGDISDAEEQEQEIRTPGVPPSISSADDVVNYKGPTDL